MGGPGCVAVAAYNFRRKLYRARDFSTKNLRASIRILCAVQPFPDQAKQGFARQRGDAIRNHNRRAEGYRPWQWYAGGPCSGSPEKATEIGRVGHWASLANDRLPRKSARGPHKIHPSAPIAPLINADKTGWGDLRAAVFPND